MQLPCCFMQGWIEHADQCSNSLKNSAKSKSATPIDQLCTRPSGARRPLSGRRQGCAGHAAQEEPAPARNWRAVPVGLPCHEFLREADKADLPDRLCQAGPSLPRCCACHRRDSCQSRTQRCSGASIRRDGGDATREAGSGHVDVTPTYAPQAGRHADPVRSALAQIALRIQSERRFFGIAPT
jgi:hypothetical protein